ncbi:MAG: peptide chain release factor N(5)-glutamine methyltransferase [Deltaproteobacteria bacterium]|nr:peptide chain release factor N(5)-glutamine methyltransferase [Deltaproteobacteria bacterium]
MTAPLTHRAALALATHRLELADLEAAAHDAVALLAHVLGRRRAEVLLDDTAPLSPEVAARLSRLVERRARREPLQHMIGSVGFHDVVLNVDRRALIPRAETETLVCAVLDWLERGAVSRPRILDLGTGTGAIAIAIANAAPGSRVVASDVSRDAAELARVNVTRSATTQSVALVVGDWLAPFRAGADFDVIVSNPPYVTTEELASLAPEVRDHDPRRALDGGSDGLGPYRVICDAAARHLRRAGLLAFEVAADRPGPVMELVAHAGFRRIECREDLGGRPRVVLGER